MAGDDVSEEEKIIRRICCSVMTFFCSNCCWAFLSLIMILIGLLGVFLTGNGLEILPPEAYITALVFGIYTLLVISMGILGACARVEICFILFIFFAAIGLLGQICSFAFLLFYSTDLSAIQAADNQIVNAKNRLVDHLDTLSENADSWVDTQNSFECCGITFEAGFELLPDEDPEEILETGDTCSDDDINLLVAAERLNLAVNQDAAADIDEFGNIRSVIDNEDFGLATGHFCVSRLSELMDQFLPLVIVIIVIYLMIQLVSLVSASRMYWVPEFLGGWMLDKDALDDIAAHKGIKLEHKEYNGGRVLSTLRTQADRMSFRIKNAVTVDDRVPKDAGFLKRLSTNRAVSFVGAAPSSGANEAEQAPRTSIRSMLSRFSMKSKGASGKSVLVIDAPGMTNSLRSQGPPPGMQSSARSTNVSTNSKLLMVADSDNPPKGARPPQSLDI